jgi:hypothetical protein
VWRLQLIKEGAAKQLSSNIREEDEKHRQVTLAGGSLTSSVGSLSCSVMLRHKSHGTFSLHSIYFHILTNLAFDVIIGYPSIRKHSLIMSRFPSLFSETCLQVALIVTSACQGASSGSAHQRMGKPVRRSCWRFPVRVSWLTSGSLAEVLVDKW